MAFFKSDKLNRFDVFTFYFKNPYNLKSIGVRLADFDHENMKW